MPIKVQKPIVETFTLDKTDARYGDENDAPTIVTVKQATQAQHEYRQDIFATLERVFDDLDPDVMTLISKTNSEELKRIETYLTLVDCNITGMNGKSPLFSFRKGSDGLPEINMTKAEFDNAWGLLPPDVATEIHEKVLKVNIMWGPRG